MGNGLQTVEFQLKKYTAAEDETMYTLGIPVGSEGGATDTTVAVIAATYGSRGQVSK